MGALPGKERRFSSTEHGETQLQVKSKAANPSQTSVCPGVRASKRNTTPATGEPEDLCVPHELLLLQGRCCTAGEDEHSVRTRSL